MCKHGITLDPKCSGLGGENISPSPARAAVDVAQIREETFRVSSGGSSVMLLSRTGADVAEELVFTPNPIAFSVHGTTISTVFQASLSLVHQ